MATVSLDTTRTCPNDSRIPAKEHYTTQVNQKSRCFTNDRANPELLQAIVRIQSLVLMLLTQKSLNKTRLSREDFFATLPFCLDPDVLLQQQHVTQGYKQSTIYAPQATKTIVREIESKKKASHRVQLMQQARLLCLHKQLTCIVIPRVTQLDHITIEEKLLNDHTTTLRGMAFYYENRKELTEAVGQFVHFLSFFSLGDILGNNRDKLNNLGADVPRFDNLLLFFANQDDKKIGRIGVVDFDDACLKDREIQTFDVYEAANRCVSLFPYHTDLIIHTAEHLCSQYGLKSLDKVDKIKKLSFKSLRLYRLIESNFSFYERHRLKIGVQSFIPITAERQEEIKSQMTDFLLRHNQDPKSLLFHCILEPQVNALQHFHDEIVVNMLEAVQKMFNSLTFYRRGNSPKNKGEMIETRIFYNQMTCNLQLDFELEHSSSIHRTFDTQCIKHQSIVNYLFEELFHNLVLGGEMAFYQKAVNAEKTDIFSL